jgi:hypothetical protein
MTERRPLAGDSPAIPATFAVLAALVRLIPLQFLHPLNWDEIEFFRATSWIGQGRLPFRDFWEHHTPLTWFLFAPITWLTDSPGVDAILALRWAQIPVWIATFWLANLWMRDNGIARFGRWSAMAIALASSMFMLPAVEYRVDSVACALFMAGLVLAQREHHGLAGAVFCLVGFANLRFGPLLVATVLVLRVRHGARANRLFAGGIAALAICLGFFAATGSLVPLYRNVWVDNAAQKYAAEITGAFFHRLLVPFGVRVMASDRLFELAAVDVGGIAVIVLGFAGVLRALLRRRESGALFGLAILQLVNLFFIASMKFIYNYHFLLVVVMMVPLIASLLERVPRRPVIALIALALGVSAFASIFRGKELDRAYQDRIMREVHARTLPGERVWGGNPWALRREPAYHFWFMPELARRLVQHQEAPPFLLDAPPAAVVFDHSALIWVVTVQREIGPYLVRHYIPVWRELWIPGMNARLGPGETFGWVVPRDGTYRLFASAALARHPWFRDPLRVASEKSEDAARFTTLLPPDGKGARIILSGKTVSGESVALRKGQRVAVVNTTGTDLGVVLLPSRDRVLFREPPPGVSLEAEATRVTHVPQIGAAIAP